MNTNDAVLGLSADGSNLIAFTSQANAGTSREGMVVFDRTNNTLNLCDGTVWRTIASSGTAGAAAGTVTGAVQFRGSTGQLAADDTNLIWDDTNNRLGMGTATPAYQFDNQKTDTSLAPNRNYISRTLLALAPTAANTGYNSNVLTSIVTSGAQNFTGDILNQYSQINHLGTGTLATGYAGFNGIYGSSTGPITTAYGTYSVAQSANAGNAITGAYGVFGDANNNTGTITNGYGVYGRALRSSANNMTTAIGTYGRAVNNNATGTISSAFGAYNDVYNVLGTATNAYGTYSRVYHIAPTTMAAVYGVKSDVIVNNASAAITSAAALQTDLALTAGTVGSYYGLKIEDEGTANANWYSIYTGTTKSYFGGNVGIGVSAPSDVLHVKDATAVVGNPTIRLEGATAGYGAGVEAGAALNGGSYLAMGKLVWDGENSWNTTASTQDSYVSLHTTLDGVVGERMRITSAGNVGIGTTGPLSDLSIGGAGNAAYTAYIKGAGATSATYGLVVQDSAAVSTFTVRNDGVVGVKSTLTATGGITSNASLVVDDVAGPAEVILSPVDSTRYSLLRLYTTDNLGGGSNVDNMWSLISYGDTYTSAGYQNDLRLYYTDYTAGTPTSRDLMYFDNAGYVGIGTVTPASKLSIGGSGNGSWQTYIQGLGTTSGTYGLVVRDSAGTNTFFVRDDGNVYVGTGGLSLGGTLDLNSAAVVGSAGTVLDANGGWVRTYNNTGWYNGTHGGGMYMADTTWVRTYNGKGLYSSSKIVSPLIGAGAITSPSQSIETDGNISMSNGGYIYGSDSSGANFLSLQAALNAADGARFIAYGKNNGTAGEARIYSATQVANTTGAIRFYNYAPAATAIGYIKSNGDLVVQGSGTTCTIGNNTNATMCSSDARLKDQLTPVTGALDSLVKLNPVYFHWKDKNKSEPQNIGLIAQDVQKVYPQLVSTDDDGYLQLAYAGLVTPLIGAVKELNARTLAQNGSIESLKAENAALRADYEILRALEVENAEMKRTIGELGRRLERLEAVQ